MGSALLVTAAMLSWGNIQPEVEVRSSARMRVLDEDIAPGGALPRSPERLELELEPRLAASTDGRLRLRLEYAPRAQLPFEPAPPGVTQAEMPSAAERVHVLHNASLMAEAPLGRWTARAGVTATHGVIDPLDRLGTRDELLVVGNRQIPYQSYGGLGAFTNRLSRRLTLDVDARASLSGGDGELAQQTLPLQREATLDNVLSFEATRRDTYAGLLRFGVSRVERGSDALTVRGGGRWLRMIDRSFSFSLQGGAVFAVERDAPTPEPIPDEEEAESFSSVSPWAEGSITYLMGPRRPSFTFTAGVEPGIDRLLGAVTSRTFAELRSGWAPLEALQFEAYGQVASWEPWLSRGAGDLGRTVVSSLGGGVGYALSPSVMVGTSVVSTWQDSGREDIRDYHELTALLEMHVSLVP